LNRGNAYQNKYNLDQAISDFTKAIKLNPHNANAYLNRGNAYQNKGNPGQAISDFTKAIELNPNDGQIYRTRAFLYFSRREYTRTWEDVHKAEAMGCSFDPGFVKELRKASKRKR
jgi:tetratricopeptide (TPR) repeat protein